MAGLLLSLALVLGLLHTDTPVERSLRHAAFDAYQRQFPRERVGDAVIVLAIDDLSLQRLGQWPWPRKELATLVERLAALKPAAIGIDMVFSEPDRLSPRVQAQRLEDQGYVSVDRPASRLPDYDQQFAQVLRRTGVALGVAGLTDDPRLRDPADYRAPLVLIGPDPSPFVVRYPSSLRSIESIDRAAAGHGAINAATDPDGRVRRLPSLVQIGGRLLPTLAVEVLRQTSPDPVLRVHTNAGGLQALEVAGHRLPVSADGTWWIHFSDPESRPIFPVASFLDGSLPAELITGRIVLIGAAASGLQDRVITPLGAMPGVSVHAEALDNLLDGGMLWRPTASAWVEAALLGVMSLAFVWGVPAMRPSRSVLMFGLALSLSVALGALAFVWRGWLIDVASPAAGATLVFALTLSMALGQTQRQRRSLFQALARSREEQARLDGELDAARRIQSGMLPDPAAVLAGEARADLHALMQPARIVGGDLYDLFRLDDGRLFFMIGDVSGKGLPASLFMALGKALIKSSSGPARGDPGRTLTEAGRAMARENPESMFVSAVAGALNLATGEMTWACAGHDAPLLLRAGSRQAVALQSAGGPPLCMVEGFQYPTEHLRLQPGDTLCLVTDGVTESVDRQGELFGSQRLVAAFSAAAVAEGSSRRIVDRLRREVERYSGGLEPADDLSLLVLRWKGGAPGP